MENFWECSIFCFSLYLNNEQNSTRQISIVQDSSVAEEACLSPVPVFSPSFGGIRVAHLFSFRLCSCALFVFVSCLVFSRLWIVRNVLPLQISDAQQHIIIVGINYNGFDTFMMNVFFWVSYCCSVPNEQMLSYIITRPS